MHNAADEECIKLSFPVNAAYVSAARLTASSIASRMQFDIDEIEDIKTAVSEACTYIIKALPPSTNGSFEINFRPLPQMMEVTIMTNGQLSPPQEDEMSLVMIRALVDKLEITGVSGSPANSSCPGSPAGVSIYMVKKHKYSIFN